MFGKRVMIVAILCLFVALFGFGFVGQARAQDDDFMQRKGIGGLFDRKGDPTKGATSTQAALGIGSIFVMIAVVKWL